MAEIITYNVEIHREDDGSYWAQVKELPGCFAYGDTEDELQDAMAEAIGLYLSTPEMTVTVTPADEDDGQSQTKEQRYLVDA